ncbi:peptidoglycan recognition protein family protein [Chitinophaga agri]|uniref:N-acetylmuramoyl-L-alanine amidase domain-containing protein n=1 Tax=Chitinophaga agri TaxID=2703787 RepID=A0A6B9ZHM6_9BACT|nr:hypothetical protein [Chitinophaga agri]QHS60834.1 hypothetical protein GWR21_14885 [Chitinophaga agri]
MKKQRTLFRDRSTLRVIRSSSRASAAKGKTGYKSNNIRYIVVHSTGTKSDMLLSQMDKLPYHFLVTRAGKLLSLKKPLSTDGTIEIALIGGLDKEGNHIDCRTERQNDTLFNKLVQLLERYPNAKIVPADKVYLYAYPNPGFSLQQWITDYVPAFLRAA